MNPFAQIGLLRTKDGQAPGEQIGHSPWDNYKIESIERNGERTLLCICLTCPGIIDAYTDTCHPLKVSLEEYLKKTNAVIVPLLPPRPKYVEKPMELADSDNPFK